MYVYVCVYEHIMFRSDIPIIDSIYLHWFVANKLAQRLKRIDQLFPAMHFSKWILSLSLPSLNDLSLGAVSESADWELIHTHNVMNGMAYSDPTSQFMCVCGSLPLVSCQQQWVMQRRRMAIDNESYVVK